MEANQNRLKVGVFVAFGLVLVLISIMSQFIIAYFILTQKDANILQADIQTTDDRKGISHFTIEVENYSQLQEILGAIKKIKNVLLVERA